MVKEVKQKSGIATGLNSGHVRSNRLLSCAQSELGDEVWAKRKYHQEAHERPWEAQRLRMHFVARTHAD